ncbi:NUDIX domain-containing protein (plasmid) [Kovacikia minuta CCNUW1]|uniref:NUDIX domain-containing protein n=1 Tax=Kovacikia minuta TaxID=2931930 RepID=UPI001CCE4D58|nr:NUDIX domain-containing protein [Kovacikia minuta]UBF30634.1 NUDIX domain-containing protein [Kovacikia minuta CCNUW1]
MRPSSERDWQVKNRFLELRSQWLTLIGEHLQTPQGQQLEYWRIEKADSVIILPIQSDRILLPSPSYRPGVGQLTLDFPGGRVPEGQTPTEAAIATLQRELGIVSAAITRLTPLNPHGWAVNSSFSNQKLYGFVAHVQDITLLSESVVSTYPKNSTGVHQLLQEMSCLQCRAVLLEWWLNQH